MVCDKCQQKLGKIITPDTWKSGSRNTTESGGRKLGENKLLTSGKNRWSPYSSNKKTGAAAENSQFNVCRICKAAVHQKGSNYCQPCAYKAGICAMCGKKMMDTKKYQMSSV